MSCIQALKGIASTCASNLSGVKAIYMAEIDDIADAKANIDDLTGHLTDHIVTITMAEDKKFVKYVITKQSSSLSSELTIDEANNVRFYTNTVNANFNKMEAAKHLEVEAIAAGQLAVIVEDNNGKFWYLGYDGYASAASQTAQTGQNYTDMNGYTTSISAMSAYLPFEVAKSQMEGSEKIWKDGTL